MRATWNPSGTREPPQKRSNFHQRSSREKTAGINLVIEKSIIHTESGRCIGAIRLEIRESAFSDVFSNVNSEINGEYFIVNASGTVMSSADKSKLFTSVETRNISKAGISLRPKFTTPAAAGKHWWQWRPWMGPIGM